VARLIGEFRPPREVVTVGIARVVGRGSVSVSAGGLVFEGRATRAPVVPPGVLAAAGAALILVGALVPGSERVVVPLLLGGTLLAVWMGWRSEYGSPGRFEVPWSGIEHVVRLPADHDVVAIVLSGALAGAGSPEQVYFAPSNGVLAFVEALREAAPALSVDLDSALREPPAPPDGD
jgi:hypothetical protein